MRRSVPYFTLFTLIAILAIAPAHAMAVANNPSAGECRAPGAGDTVVLIGGQLCAANQGSGGNAGTGTGALPGGRQPGETIWVTGEIPECLRNSARCLPGQIGGRGGRQSFDGEGPGGGSMGRGMAGSGTKAKVPWPKTPDKLTKEDCLKLRDGSSIDPYPRLIKQAKDELNAGMLDAAGTAPKLLSLWTGLEGKRAELDLAHAMLRLPVDHVRVLRGFIPSVHAGIWDLLVHIRAIEQRYDDLIGPLQKELNVLEAEAMYLTGEARERCEKLFGSDFFPGQKKGI